MSNPQVATSLPRKLIGTLKAEALRREVSLSYLLRGIIEEAAAKFVVTKDLPAKPARLVLTDSQKRTIAAIRAAEPGTIMPRQTIADLTAAGEPIEFIELVREEIKLRNDEAVEDTRTPEEIERDNAARAEFLATIDED